MSGSSKLPYGTLALGAEGIKDAIRGFDDAYNPIPHFPAIMSDILVDVNRTLKMSDCPLTWSTRTQKRAKHISHHHHCPRLQPRTLKVIGSSRRTVSRLHWRRRFQAHPQARSVLRPRPRAHLYLALDR